MPTRHVRLVTVLLAAVALLAAGCTQPADTNAYFGEPVQVDGAPLAPAERDQADPATGQTVPTLTGTTPDGQPITIDPAAGELGTIIVAAAHHCSHCQREIPALVEWLEQDGNRLPDGIDVVTVATANDPNRPNGPAGEWLERERWPYPVLLDDNDDTALNALGVTAFPFFIFVDADGNVAGRVSGAIGGDNVADLAGQLAAGQTGASQNGTEQTSTDAGTSAGAPTGTSAL